MVVSKLASIRMVALAAILTGTVWQSPRAEETATQHSSDSASCARSTFRVLIDVGHTATSPGADSARGVHEYEFNLKLADVIAQSLRGAGFDKTVRLITSGTRFASLFKRVASANHLHVDLFLSIHHDSVPGNLKDRWEYEGKRNYYSDRFGGYAIFVSNDNADRADSLAFGHSLGQELQKRGLRYTPHYTFPVMGRYRHQLADPEAGVYRYDHLRVLHSTLMPAVLLEAGSIVNRQEELELATPPFDCGRCSHRRGRGFLCEPRANDRPLACGQPAQRYRYRAFPTSSTGVALSLSLSVRHRGSFLPHPPGTLPDEQRRLEVRTQNAQPMGPGCRQHPASRHASTEQTRFATGP